jgi:hypothetical protein
VGLISVRDAEFVTRRWIGVHQGYLGDFSYRTHHEFYPDYCDIEDIDSYRVEGTTRVRFETILMRETPARQSRILRGVLKKFPNPHDKTREAEHSRRLQDLIARCEGGIPIEPVKPAEGRVIVELALREAEDRIREGEPLSAVDRMHTAFAGFLEGIAAERKVETGKDAPTTKVFKLLRLACPELRPARQHGEQIERVLNSLASVMDALNPLRNHGTLAHANEHLIEAAEAMLYVNAVKTLMHYLNSKLRTASPKPPAPSVATNAALEEFDDDVPF